MSYKNKLIILNLSCLLFVIIFIFVLLFLTQRNSIYVISGESMASGLHDKDRIILQDNNEQISHNEIVVFEKPSEWDKAHRSLAKFEVIKRVQAVPGDKISVENGKLKVEETEKEFSLPEECSLPEGYSLTIPENKYFVMGDNREESVDSLYMLCNNLGEESLVSEELIEDHGEIRMVL